MARKVAERTVVSLALRYVKLFPAEAVETLAAADRGDVIRVLDALDDGAALVAVQQAPPATLAAWLLALPPARLERLGPRLDRAKAGQALEATSGADRERLAAAIARPAQ